MQKDISRIKAVETALLELTNELDARVSERTRELSIRQGELESANRQLEAIIEELKRTQTELIEAEKMASLGRLVAGVAHEVNTPLGVGVTALSYLRGQLAALKTTLARQMRPDQAHTLIGPLEDAGALVESNLFRAANLVKSFKQVAVDQSTSGIRTVAVREYLEGTLQSLHPTLRKTRHTVRVECPAGLEMTSRPDALYQVVVNLVMNSVVHGFPDGRDGTFTITVHDETPQLRVVYTDDGVGMDDAVAQRVFEPFFTTKRAAGGSGLGMHIAYNLVVQALAGRINLTTAPGAGVRFEIVFPRVHPQAARSLPSTG
jgi:C4-dicarboxylate-specific signal transduction histidine kinase